MGEVPDITDLLASAGAGDRAVVDEILPHLYHELRRLAAAQLGGGGSVTIDPTGVVHEAYIRLIHQNRVRWESRGHFLATAARAMRNILVDQARRKSSLKRGGGRRREGDASDLPIEVGPGVDEERLLSLDEALERLEADDPRKGQLVTLRFFAGLTNEQVAEVMGVSLSTVEREWRFARSWLHNELSAD